MFVLSKRSLQYPLIIVTVIILCYIFFFRLDNLPLESYDEAWYGSISRNLSTDFNPFRLSFNKNIFTDHPPFGFILMSIPAILFGSNEFTVRFISALLGLVTLILVFYVQKNMTNKPINYCSSFVLVSSLWFMLRARSGNLDIPFSFLSLLTFFFLQKANQKIKFYYFASLSFALLFLTKTLVGLGILPVFLFSLYLNRKKISLSFLLKLVFIWLLVVSPWYIFNQLSDKSFLYHHFFEIGVRGQQNNISIQSLAKSLFYLQVGMGKWYKVFLFSVFLTPIVWIKATKKEKIYLSFLFLYLLGFFLPFLFSQKTEVWHLIPTHIPISLIIVHNLFLFLKNNLNNKPYLYSILFLMFISVSFFQFYQSSNLIYQNHTDNPQKDISQKASKYSQIYLMETFYPALVYYSNSKVIPFYWENKAYEQMEYNLKTNHDKIFLINDDFLSKLKNNNVYFDILDQNNNYYLIK